jgi:small subunit ribosomal protein S16
LQPQNAYIVSSSKEIGRCFLFLTTNFFKIMAVKIRLQRKGRKQAPFYHIVIADARAPRDGKFIERIGSYNPMTSPATIEIDREKALSWLANGAQPTDTVAAILRFKGVLLRKHLQLGVKKGAITQEQADAQWGKWNDEKEASVEKRRAETAAKKEAFRMMVSGTPKPVKAAPAAPAAEETAE